MITDDKHWNILISHVLQMKRRDWTNSSDFVTNLNIILIEILQWYLSVYIALRNGILDAIKKFLIDWLMFILFILFIEILAYNIKLIA